MFWKRKERVYCKHCKHCNEGALGISLAKCGAYKDDLHWYESRKRLKRSKYEFCGVQNSGNNCPLFEPLVAIPE